MSIDPRVLVAHQPLGSSLSKPVGQTRARQYVIGSAPAPRHRDARTTWTGLSPGHVSAPATLIRGTFGYYQTFVANLEMLSMQDARVGRILDFSLLCFLRPSRVSSNLHRVRGRYRPCRPQMERRTRCWQRQRWVRMWLLGRAPARRRRASQTPARSVETKLA